MNFFFQRKLKTQLHETRVPVREEFLRNLRTSLVNAAEEDQKASFFDRMNWYTRILSLSAIPLGMAVIVVTIQLTHHTTPSVRTVLNIPEVLAESIQNTFQIGNTKDFIHQRLAVYFGLDTSVLNVESWRYQDEFRTSFRPKTDKTTFEGWEYLQSDTQSCSYTSMSTSSSMEEIEKYVPHVECTEDVDVHYPPLVSGGLALADVHVEDVPQNEQGGEADAYLVWSSRTALEPEVAFSFYRSGYEEGDGAAHEVSVRQPSSPEGELYVYRAPLFIPKVGNTGPLQDADGTMQLVQVRSGDQQSAIFDVDLIKHTVSALTPEALNTIQQTYVRAARDLAREINSPEERYDDFFGVALALKDQLADLTPLSQTDELYQGQQATRVRYVLPAELTAQEEYVDIAQIEFVVDVQNKKIVEYATFDLTGKSVQQVSVEKSEIVTDVEPSEFFSVDAWKKDIGAE